MDAEKVLALIDGLNPDGSNREYLRGQLELAFDLLGVDCVPCPRNRGEFDCTPFCELCSGEQEFRRGEVS